jgi:hypothetical protein
MTATATVALRRRDPRRCWRRTFAAPLHSRRSAGKVKLTRKSCLTVYSKMWKRRKRTKSLENVLACVAMLQVASSKAITVANPCSRLVGVQMLRDRTSKLGPEGGKVPHVPSNWSPHTSSFARAAQQKASRLAWKNAATCRAEELIPGGLACTRRGTSCWSSGCRVLC